MEAYVRGVVRITRRFSTPSAKTRTGVLNTLDCRSVKVFVPLLSVPERLFALRLAVFRLAEELMVSVRVLPELVSMVRLEPCMS